MDRKLLLIVLSITVERFMINCLPYLKIISGTDFISPFYLEMAYRESLNSPDPSTQLGAILTNEYGGIISRGYNRFPEKVTVTNERLDRSQKLFYMEHAERNAIFAALKESKDLNKDNMILYCPWYACSDCARAIINSGIKTVIGHKQMFDKTPDRWKESIIKGFEMFEESGTLCYAYDGSLGCDFEVRFDGKLWKP